MLPDGRVVINGGEYNYGYSGWISAGAIYDPLADSWTSVSPPSGWSTIGDGQSVVLADGTYMLANCCSTQQALLNASTLTWTNTGSGKADWNDEEGWTLLPDGTVLTVDAYVYAGCGTNTERYNPATGAWTSAGNVPSQLADCSGNRSYEMGPQVLRPDGTVIAFGGTTTGTASTAIYDTSSNTWSAGPNIPSVGGTPYTIADGPAALLPNGNVLFAASPSNWPNGSAFPTPVHFFEFDGTSMNQVADTTLAAYDASYIVNFLVLPTGEVLETDFSSTIDLYTPSGSPNLSWKPVISSLSSTNLVGGNSYVLSGTQFNGLSQGASYGDDQQSATNYPIVRVANNATGHIFYARTYGHSSMTVAPGVASTTNFILPGDIESGASTLVAVANGIASDPVFGDRHARFGQHDGLARLAAEFQRPGRRSVRVRRVRRIYDQKRRHRDDNVFDFAAELAHRVAVDVPLVEARRFGKSEVQSGARRSGRGCDQLLVIDRVHQHDQRIGQYQRRRQSAGHAGFDREPRPER